MQLTAVSMNVIQIDANIVKSFPRFSDWLLTTVNRMLLVKYLAVRQLHRFLHKLKLYLFLL